MPNFFQRLKRGAVNLLLKRITNSEELRSILVGGGSGSFVSSQYRPLARAGFKENDVGFYIIGEIARSVASIKLLLGDQPPDIKRIFTRPQQKKPWKIWIFEQMVYRLIGGESYAEIIRIQDRITELPIIRPDRIHPELGIDEETLLRWRVTRGGIQKHFLEDEIWFSRLLDPLKDWEGWGPLQATRDNIDNRNSISRLNKNVLDNNAAPFGILKLKQPTDGIPLQMGQEQIDEIGRKINSKMERGAGKTVVLDWDFAFERIGQTGREMDFTKTDELSARKTAMTFGFPPVLLGFAAGTTFANFREAKEYLMLNTVLPHLEMVLCDVSMELGLDEPVQPDKKSIAALADLTMRKRESARKDKEAGIISVEEAREEGGYPEEVNGALTVDPRFIPIE